MPFLRAALIKKERLAREKSAESPVVAAVAEIVAVAETVPESLPDVGIVPVIVTVSEPNSESLPDTETVTEGITESEPDAELPGVETVAEIAGETESESAAEIPESEAELLSDTETVPEAVAESEPESESLPDTEYVPAVMAESEPDADTVPEAVAESESESVAGIAESEPEFPPDIETVTESEPELSPDIETVTEADSELPTDTETIPESEPESFPDTESLTEGSPENVAEEFTLADESVHAPEDNGYSSDIQEIQNEESPEPETGSDGAAEETSPEIPPQEQALEPDTQLPPEIADALAEPEQEAPQSHSQKDYSGSQLDYDFTSGERYVDKVSTKTEFDRMLDELAAISKDLLSWEADKFAKKYTGKFEEGDSSVADARKFEAFLGGYITNAAMLLYDKGYRDAAIKQLEQAISILQARKKLEDETLAIKSSVEENNDVVDLSDILGLFGDG